MKFFKYFPTLLLFIFLSSCASSTGIFSAAPLSTSPGEDDLPNPIKLISDTVNNRLYVINSNLDFYYNTSSIYTLSVDASTPATPALSVISSIETPNYASDALTDGTSIYVAFREGTDEDSEIDRLYKYTINSDGSLTLALTASTGKDPFGMAFAGANILVVCNDELEIFDTSLNLLATVDLTAADDADFDDSDSEAAESVAYDATNNRAYVTNRNGRIFIVDLASNILTHVIDGPITSRDIATDGTYMYIIDGDPSALWIFNLSLLPAVTSAPEEVDDSEFVVTEIPLGATPSQLELDLVNNRAYVSNASDPSISVIDLSIFQEIARISLDEDDTGLTDSEFPFDISAATFGGTDYAIVGNLTSNTIEFIDANTFDVLTSYPE